MFEALTGGSHCGIDFEWRQCSTYAVTALVARLALRGQKLGSKTAPGDGAGELQVNHVHTGPRADQCVPVGAR